MRFAKREAGKWATYNVKDASTWEEQQKETKKLTKFAKRSNQPVKPATEAKNSKKIIKKVRIKNHFENVLNDKLKLDKRAKKSGIYEEVAEKDLEKIEEKSEEKGGLATANEELVAKNLGGSIYKIGGACHECGSKYHLVRDCPEMEAKRIEKKNKKKNQFTEDDDGSIPIAHAFVMDESRGIEDEYYTYRD